MPEAATPVEPAESLSRALAKYYFVGLSWLIASFVVLTRELGLPSVAIGDSYTLHVDHLVIVGAVFVAIVFPLVCALVEVASTGR